MVAMDANTRKELWKTKVADVADGETTLMAPLVAKRRVFVDLRAVNSAFAAGKRHSI